MKNLPWGLLSVFVLPVLFFFGVSFFVLISSVLILTKKSAGFVNLTSPANKSVYNLFSSPPQVLGALSSTATLNDSRAVTLEQFFAKYHSPLASYGDIFIKTAEKYEVPWELLPAISMQESIGGKNMPEDCYNPFGWGIHARGTLCFETWEKGIETVAKGLKEKYVDQGLITLEQIMSKYNPTSYNRDGSWGKGVQFFLSEIESFNTP